MADANIPMRRKVLQDVANALGQILVGWRIADDLETLADLPDGTLVFDVLRGTAEHGARGALPLRIAGELAAWFRERLAALGLPFDAIVEARIKAEFRTDRIRTDKTRIVSFDWICESCVATGETRYIGRLAEKHRWHRRAARGGSLKK